MRRTKILLSLSVLMVLSGTAVAQKSPPQTVEDRKAVMDAQIELLKKDAEVKRAQRDAAVGGMLNLPSIASISKVGTKYTALLQMANGTNEYVSEGDMLRQGLLVTTITGRQVIVSVMSGKKMVPMPLDFVAITNPSALPMNPLGNTVPPELLPPVPSVVLPTNPPLVNDGRSARPAAAAASAQAASAVVAPALNVPASPAAKGK